MVLLCLQKFKSHCAPDAPSAMTFSQLSIAELKAKLQSLGQPQGGKKSTLIARLEAATAQAATAEEKTTAVPPAEAAAAAVEGERTSTSGYPG